MTRRAALDAAAPHAAASASCAAASGLPPGTVDTLASGSRAILHGAAARGRAGGRSSRACTRCRGCVVAVAPGSAAPSGTAATTSRPGTPGTPDAGSCESSPAPSARPRVARAALPLFSEGLLQHRAIQCQVGDHLLQPPVLLAQLPQLTQLRRADAVVLPLPAVERRLGDPELA